MADRDPAVRDEDEEQLIDAEDIGEEIDKDEDHPMEEINMDEDIVEGGGFEEALELQNDSIAHFDGHSDSVFSISSHPKQPLIVVTGSGDDSAFVWSCDPKPDLLPHSFETGRQWEPKGPGRESLGPITQLKGHTDTIISTAFTQPSGDFVLTAGMDGRLRAYETNHDGLPLTEANAYHPVAEVQEVEEIAWLSICPNTDRPNVLALGASDGSVWVYEVVSHGAGNAELQVLQAYYQHTSSCTAGTWTASGTLLATVSEESSLFVFDPFGLAPSTTPGVGGAVVGLTAADQRFEVEGGLYSVTISPGGMLCAVGGAGGAIRVVGLPRTAIDPAAPAAGTSKSQKGGQGARSKAGGGKQAGAPGVTAQAGGQGQAGQVVASMVTGGDSVEALAFSPTGALLAAGDVDGNLRLFDTGHNFALRRHIAGAHEDQAVVSFIWESAGRPVGSAAPNSTTGSSVLYSCGNDGVLRKWDARTGTPLGEWKGHRGGGDGGGIMGFVLVKDEDGKDLAVTAGDDGVSLVFDVTT